MGDVRSCPRAPGVPCAVRFSTLPTFCYQLPTDLSIVNIISIKEQTWGNPVPS